MLWEHKAYNLLIGKEEISLLNTVYNFIKSFQIKHFYKYYHFSSLIFASIYESKQFTNSSIKEGKQEINY